MPCRAGLPLDGFRVAPQGRDVVVEVARARAGSGIWTLIGRGGTPWWICERAQKIASRALAAPRQCPDAYPKISLCEKRLGFGEQETRATLPDPAYGPLLESEPFGLVEEAAALASCVCGQEIAPGLSVFGSVLCHDCRGDSRRVDAALGRALVRAEAAGRVNFAHRRAA